jgi:hypothetical protein
MAPSAAASAIAAKPFDEKPGALADPELVAGADSGAGCDDAAGEPSRLVPVA